MVYTSLIISLWNIIHLVVYSPFSLRFPFPSWITFWKLKKIQQMRLLPKPEVVLLSFLHIIVCDFLRKQRLHHRIITTFPRVISSFGSLRVTRKPLPLEPKKLAEVVSCLFIWISHWKIVDFKSFAGQQRNLGILTSILGRLTSVLHGL